METNEKKTTARDLFLRTIAVLGLIAILLLGAWGIIQLAFALPTVFSNLGNSISSLFTHNTTTTPPANKEAISITVPATTVSGQTLQISWMHQNADKNGQYSYAISYACPTAQAGQSGLTIKAPLPNGSFQTIPCNTPFNYVNATQHMDIVPSATAATPLTLTVTAIKLATGAVTASGTATTNITVAAGTTKPTTTTKPVKTTPAKPATTYYPATTRPATMYGYGDLAATITSVIPSNGLTTVKFTVSNDGTNIINAGWTFNATLPINGSYTFASQPQQALYPGDKIAYVLTFSSGTSYGYQNGYGYSANGYTTSGYNCSGYTCNNNNVVVNGYPYQNYGYGSGAVIINIDPLNYVVEYNKNNNIAQTTVPLY